jgi:hypothetical protein
MAFIGISALLPPNSSSELWLYPIKIMVVVRLLIFFWSSYQELRKPGMSDGKEIVLAVGHRTSGVCPVGPNGLVMGHARRAYGL